MSREAPSAAGLEPYDEIVTLESRRYVLRSDISCPSLAQGESVAVLANCKRVGRVLRHDADGMMLAMSEYPKVTEAARPIWVQSDVVAPGRRDGGAAEVGLLLVSPSGKLAVTRKVGYPDPVLRFPTGGVEPGESPQQAAVREFAEELQVSGDQVSTDPLIRVSYSNSSFETWFFAAKHPTEEIRASSGGELEVVAFVDAQVLPGIAAALESLPSTERGTGTWQQWGAFRAASMRAVYDSLIREPALLASEGRQSHAIRSRTYVRVLGPVEVELQPGAVVQLNGRHAQLLTHLALAMPATLTKEQLAQRVWKRDIPSTTLQAEINRLREKIGDVVVTVGRAGYVLATESVELDVREFAKHREAASAARSNGWIDGALEELDAALGLWRGKLAGGAIDETYAMELEGHRYAAERARLDLLLDNGDPNESVARAEGLLATHPYDEELLGILLLGLYRAGRQQDALTRAAEFQSTLRKDLGVDPSPRLSQLQQRILKQDKSLDSARKRRFSAGSHDPNFELAFYWGFRPAAHSDIRNSILSCTRSLEVAGQGMTTIADTLNDPAVIKTLKAALVENPTLHVRLLIAPPSIPEREREVGGQNLQHKAALGLRQLTHFAKSLERADGTSPVELLTYPSGYIPRHFMLQCDDSLYVGSYLSHREGSHSYLMKLFDFGDGLYELFANELAHVLKLAVALPQNEDRN